MNRSSLVQTRGSTWISLAAAALTGVGALQAQLIYQEDFNTDGDGTRYTTAGRGLILLNIENNKEPSYWTHSSDVTKAGEIIGVVVPAAGRRAALTFQSAVPEALLTPEALKLIDNTINWLTSGKKGKAIMSPAVTGEGDQVLSARLTAAGYTVADDDTGGGLPDAATVALAISTSGGLPAPTRFTRYGAPVLTFNGPNHDDELVTSIGSANLNLDPGDVTITDTTHPIAAGLPKTFRFVTEAVGLDTVGTTLPEGSKVIATYKFPNPDTGVEEDRPLLIVIEKGDNLLGGSFKDFEGSGYWAGADMNEPTIREDACCTSEAEPRSLTLKSVNVAGKKDLRITVALAATDIDFETSDFLKILIDPDGNGPEEFTQLVRFSPPTGNDKYFTDETGANRLSVRFRDVSYPIPGNPTDLVVRFEATSTFFNEILGFDNIRIHSGLLATAKPPISEVKAVKANNALSISWKNGNNPFVVRGAASLAGPWVELVTTDANTIDLPLGLATGFFQIGEKAATTVKLFKASLSGANEVPPVNSTATGYGLIGLDAANKKANYLVTYEGLSTDLSSAHLHGPGSASQSVGVLFAISPGLPGSNRSGAFVGTATLDDAKLGAIQSLNAYFNIHSTANGSGEIRGQLQNP